MAKREIYSREKYDLDLSIRQYVDSNGLDMEDVFNDAEEKADFLKHFGHGKVRVSGGKGDNAFEEIDVVLDDRPVQVTSYARTIYEQAVKRIEGVESGRRKISDLEIKVEANATNILKPTASQGDILGKLNYYDFEAEIDSGKFGLPPY